MAYRVSSLRGTNAVAIEGIAAAGDGVATGREPLPASLVTVTSPPITCVITQAQSGQIIDLAERLIGSIRRECVDHIVVLGETHFRRVLKSYARYYNEMRTHRSLYKDAPLSRSVQRTGRIMSRAILGGLHHYYARA